MLITTPLPALHLDDNQIVRLERATGTRLTAQDGHLWITLDGELDDRILEAGESWVVPSPEDVLVSAFRGPATLALRSADGHVPSASMALTEGEGGRLARWLDRMVPSSLADVR